MQVCHVIIAKRLRRKAEAYLVEVECEAWNPEEPVKETPLRRKL